MSGDDASLLEAARAARKEAYCPYSNFPIGAAVLTSDGRVFVGCNVENASYGLTVCAERVAVFNAITSGASAIRKIAISCLKGDPKQPETVMPCGACRQVLQEFMTPDSQIIVDAVGAFALMDILPLPFTFKAQRV